MTDGENKFGEGVLYDLIESAINSGMYAALYGRYMAFYIMRNP